MRESSRVGTHLSSKCGGTPESTTPGAGCVVCGQQQGTQWHVGHTGLQRSKCWASLEGSLEWGGPKGEERLVYFAPPAKALEPMAAAKKRLGHDYWRVTEKDTSLVDISAQTTAICSPRMTSQSNDSHSLPLQVPTEPQRDLAVGTSPSTKKCRCHTAQRLRHIGGGFRGTRTREESNL